MAAYFVRYNCPHCEELHEVHSYIFSDDPDLAGYPICEAYFEEQFLKYREGIRCPTTKAPIKLGSDQFVLEHVPS
ncbi:MAG: hypothetical protein QOF62_1432 [Pyrinomonadaceae bacterium]|jgi:hypothetical protein|nr:hypothetical protein [Pyrinomonadaceae bacterium]